MALQGHYQFQEYTFGSENTPNERVCYFKLKFDVKCGEGFLPLKLIHHCKN